MSTWKHKGPSCSKKRYRDEIAAKMAMSQVQRQDKDGHHECRAYRCPSCNGWHLTSKAKRGGRNR